MARLKSDVLCVDVLSPNIFPPPNFIEDDDDELIELLSTLIASRRAINLNLRIDWSSLAPRSPSAARFLKFFFIDSSQAVNASTRADNIVDVELTTTPIVHGVITHPLIATLTTPS